MVFVAFESSIRLCVLARGYTTMILGLAKAGNISEANGLFDRFKANGGVPDSASYNAWMHTHFLRKLD